MRKLIFLMTFLLTSSWMLMGAGFQLFEAGTKATGFAGAFTAQASDPSSIFYNPAGIAFLDGYQLYLGATFITPKSSFEGANPYPGFGLKEEQEAMFFYPPGLYYVMPIGEKIRVGLGVFSPFGLATKWKNKDKFTGRFVSQYADLTHIAINPAIAWRVTDNLAIGATFDYRISSVALERNIPLFDPFTFSVKDVAHLKLSSGFKNSGFGFSVGLKWKIKEYYSIGLSYRHKVEIDYDGKAEFTQISTGNSVLDQLVRLSIPFGETPGKATIVYPGMASLGFSTSVLKNWIFEIDFNWTQWSTYNKLPIEFTEHPELNPSEEAMKKYYEDVFSVRMGAERKFSEKLFFRLGYVYDKSPSLPESVSPMLPDADRHGLTIGFSYNFGKFYVDIANMFLFFEKRSTEGRNTEGYNGTYKTFANLFGIHFGYKF
ncbi:MAG: OmpP1/FadL family transporter [Candidatus Aminicenantia bacterium]